MANGSSKLEKTMIPLMYDNLHVMPTSRQIMSLLTMIRDKTLRRSDFVFHADRLMRLLVEEALNFLPVQEKTVTTPLEVDYQGTKFVGKICAVPILRAGDSMLNAVRAVCQGIRIGHILIQRDEKTAEPRCYYKKFPKDIAKRFVLLLDPMLATGNSACMAIEELLKLGVQEEKIIFVNLICCPEGVQAVLSKYPKVKLVTIAIDDGLNELFFIIKGLGDFGDRYFGTDGVNDDEEEEE